MVVLILGLPIGLLASIPTSIALHQGIYQSWIICISIVLMSGLLAFAHIRLLQVLWTRGIKHYDSIGG